MLHSDRNSNAGGQFSPRRRGARSLRTDRSARRQAPSYCRGRRSPQGLRRLLQPRTGTRTARREARKLPQIGCSERAALGRRASAGSARRGSTSGGARPPPNGPSRWRSRSRPPPAGQEESAAARRRGEAPRTCAPKPPRCGMKPMAERARPPEQEPRPWISSHAASEPASEVSAPELASQPISKAWARRRAKVRARWAAAKAEPRGPAPPAGRRDRSPEPAGWEPLASPAGPPPSAEGAARPPASALFAVGRRG